MPERTGRLPRRERLRKTQAFRLVYDTGDVRRGRTLIVIMRHEAGLERKVGFVSSRKVGDSVRRNRARRLLREAYRRLRPDFTSRGIEAHTVFVARRAIVNAELATVRTEMKRLLVSIGAIRESGPSNADD